MPRQTGKSTTLYLICFTTQFLMITLILLYLQTSTSTARDLLGRLQLAYENLPNWMQQGIIAWNKGSLELENGSKISALYFFICCQRWILSMSSFSTSSPLSRITLLTTSLPLFILLYLLDKAQKSS